MSSSTKGGDKITYVSGEPIKLMVILLDKSSNVNERVLIRQSHGLFGKDADIPIVYELPP